MVINKPPKKPSIVILNNTSLKLESTVKYLGLYTELPDWNYLFQIWNQNQVFGIKNFDLEPGTIFRTKMKYLERSIISE